MKTIYVKALHSLFSSQNLKAAQELGGRPFAPRHIILCFAGWEFFEGSNRYIDASEERNIVWFESTHYYINGKKFNRPATMKACMEDCQSAQIRLRWNESILNQFYSGY